MARRGRAATRRGLAALASTTAAHRSLAPSVGGHVTSLILLDAGHTTLALAVGLPLYIPFLLWNARRVVAQGRALVIEARKSTTAAGRGSIARVNSSRRVK